MSLRPDKCAVIIPWYFVNHQNKKLNDEIIKEMNGFVFRYKTEAIKNKNKNCDQEELNDIIMINKQIDGCLVGLTACQPLSSISMPKPVLFHVIISFQLTNNL